MTCHETTFCGYDITKSILWFRANECYFDTKVIVITCCRKYPIGTGNKSSD